MAKMKIQTEPLEGFPIKKITWKNGREKQKWENYTNVQTVYKYGGKQKHEMKLTHQQNCQKQNGESL